MATRPPRRAASLRQPAESPEKRGAARAEGKLRAIDADELRVRRISVSLPIVALVLLGLLLAMAAFHTVIVQRQTEIDSLNQFAATARAQNDRLRLELAHLESPERIMAEAGDLGMVEAPSLVYLPSRPSYVTIGGDAAAGESGGQ